MNKRLFSDLTTDEKLTVLEKLLQNPEIRRQAEDIAASIAVEKVKEEDIYRRVSHAVGNLDIAEDVWAHSGRTRHGYVDVYDKADEVFDDAIRPFMHTLAQYRKTGLVEQATACCCGLIRGIMDVDSEYLEWIPDAPRERIDSIVEECRQRNEMVRNQQKIMAQHFLADDAFFCHFLEKLQKNDLLPGGFSSFFSYSNIMLHRCTFDGRSQNPSFFWRR